MNIDNIELRLTAYKDCMFDDYNECYYGSKTPELRFKDLDIGFISFNLEQFKLVTKFEISFTVALKNKNKFDRLLPLSVFKSFMHNHKIKIKNEKQMNSYIDSYLYDNLYIYVDLYNKKLGYRFLNKDEELTSDWNYWNWFIGPVSDSLFEDTISLSLASDFDDLVYMIEKFSNANCLEILENIALKKTIKEVDNKEKRKSKRI